MKILLISARYFPHRGGLETVVHHLAQELCHQGHSVRIVTNRYPRTLSHSEVIDGISVTRLHFLIPSLDFVCRGRLDLWVASLFLCRWTEYSLRRIIEEFQPDVINNHYLNEVSELVGRVLRKHSLPVPWVISLHGGDVDGEPFLDQAHRTRFQKRVSQARFLTACSVHLSKAAVGLESSITGKINVIHNGIDSDLFSKARPSSDYSRYLLAVGQLVPHKGFDLLIEAFSQIAANHPHVKLIIAGDGELRLRLEEIIKGKELTQRVSLLGRLDSSQVASLIAGCLFVAMPSRRDSFGIVALEAMAAGKCVLAAPVGGIPEFLPCPPNQMVPLALKDWRIALDHWLCRAELGQLDGSQNCKAAERYKWSTVTQHYLAVYQQALAS